MRLRIVLLALSTLAAASPLPGQSPQPTPRQQLTAQTPGFADELSPRLHHADPRLVLPAPTAVLEEGMEYALPASARACRSGGGRVATGAALGLVAGGLLGFLHGSAGHPGLPHTGLDIPDEWEYTPFFALAGAIAGGVLGARRTADCG